MISAMGATPVSMVSTATLCARPLSKRRKSDASRPSTERPLRSVTLTGTTTKRDLTSKRESWARSDTATRQRMGTRAIEPFLCIRTAIDRPRPEVKSMRGI